MRRLGVTGGIGMGKSTCGAILEELGVPVIDTDDVARAVVVPGSAGLKGIEAHFGSEVLRPDGTLDRSALARSIFQSPEERKALEAILHPRIRESWRSQLLQWETEGHSIGAVTIPLLFETDSQQELDVVACIVCSRKEQRKRLLARGWTLEQAESRIAAQLPIEEKTRRSSFVIWAEGEEANVREQWRRTLGNI